MKSVLREKRSFIFVTCFTINIMEKTKESASLTEGSPFKKILLFSLPLMLSNVLQVAFNMSDVAVVGRFAGSTELGAVGSTTIYVGLFTGLLIGLGSSVNSLTAMRLGANDEEGVKRIVHTAALLCFIAGIVVCATGCALARPVLKLLNTHEEFMDGACRYVYIYFAGMPALGVYNFGNGVFSADGDTKKPLLLLTLSGVLNVGLNLFFVIVCKLAVAGVALASAISQYVSAVTVVIALRLSKRPYKLNPRLIRLHKKEAKSLLLLGVPAGFQNAIFSMANLFIQSGVNYFDNAFIEGNSAAANADALVYDVMAAIYTACSSFIGQYYGANKNKGILKCYLISVLYSFLVGLMLGSGLVFAGKYFFSLFTTDKEVIAAGIERMRLIGFVYCISAFMDCTIAASRGLGKTVIPTVMVILGSCVFRVIWVYTVFAHFHTVASLYLLYPASWALTAAAEIIYFAITYKKILRGSTVVTA